jgi:hypothetical protein
MRLLDLKLEVGEVDLSILQEIFQVSGLNCVHNAYLASPPFPIV